MNDDVQYPPEVVTEKVWPVCGKKLQWHSLSVWCLACGYGANRTHEPGKRT